MSALGGFVRVGLYAHQTGEVNTYLLELTDDEQVVLYVSCVYKSGHRREYAARAGVDGARWTAASLALMGKGLLARNGSVTVGGKNAKAQAPRPEGMY